MHGPGGTPREMRAAEPESAKHQVTVVLVQYDRKKYAGALEGLLAVLSPLQNISFRVLLVDNAEPGEWHHELTDQLTHIGGDNSSWEFSAFDNGLAFAREQEIEQDLFLLVTDAYAAYGSEFLDLIDEDVIDAALSWKACIGWVDAAPEELALYGSHYREWIRTSFVFVPTDLIRQIEPLAYAIDEKAVFGGNAQHLFVEDSPVGAELQQFMREWLLEQPDGKHSLPEQWHSKFELTDENYPLFQAKACTIIREHMLSVRLREANIPVFDFRLFPHFRESYVGPKFLLEDPEIEWEWLTGSRRQLLETPTQDVRYHIDRAEMPRSINAGDEEELVVAGWAQAGRRIETVRMRFSGGGSTEALCDLEPHDLFPDGSDGRDMPVTGLP